MPVGEGFDTNNLFKWVGDLEPSQIELILVYDGTDQKERKSLSKLLNQSPTLNKHLLDSSRRNPGGTRNVGLKAVTGDWFLFCDADDLPEIENLLKAIRKSSTQTQLIVGQYNRIRSGAHANTIVSKTKSTNDMIGEIGLWRILFQTSLFGRNRFPDSRMGEDQAFLLSCLTTTRKIEFTDLVFYNYYSSIKGQLTKDRKKFNELAGSIRFAIENLAPDSLLNRAEAEFCFAILVRLLITHLIKGLRLSESMKLASLVWGKFTPISLFAKSIIMVRVIIMILSRFRSS